MNILKAFFSGGCTQITAAGALWQWDQGQILQIVGLDLPDAYQVEFSNQPVRGTAAPMIGGVDGVEIPDVYLTTGKPVYAFVVLHAGEDDRETEYKITIPVNARPQPTDVQPTPEQQGVIDQLIAALNAGVEKAEDAAAQAEAAISYMPKIVDGTWWVYDAETETWADTGIQAEGQDGVGISGAVLNADYTLTLTFTNGTSYTTPPIRGAQGERGPIGPTPDISIGTVTTGAAGSPAAATMTGTPERPVLNLTIPRGDPGEVTQAEFDDLADEVSQQKSAIEDLEALTNRKAGMLIDSVSGAIASFVPDATVPNLLGVTVDIEPVQDLHGYDNPWPAGGGVNKFDVGAVTSADFSISDGTFTNTQTDTRTFFQLSVQQRNNGAYVKSVAAYSAANTGRIFAKISGIEAGITSLIIKHNGATRDLVLCDYPWTGTDDLWISLNIVSNNPTVAGGLVISDIQLEIATAGSTQASAFTPYSNLCPISGWNSVEVQRTGTNLLSHSATTQTINGVTFTVNDDGTISLSGTATQNTNYFLSPGARDWPNGTFTLSGCPAGGGTSTYYLRIDNATGGSLAHDWGGGTGRPQFTLTDGKIYSVFINVKAGVNTDRLVFRPMVEIGTTATDYKPYAGNRYVIQLGQTVYGGTLDVTNGTLTVDRASVRVADSSIITGTTSVDGTHRYNISVAGIKRATDASVLGNLICSSYPNVTALATYCVTLGASVSHNSNSIYIYDPEFATATVAEFKTAKGDVQLVYELATPITIDLDPVTISTISGQTNNVWADAGDVDVTYAADIKAYIDRLNQPTEDDMIANTLIQSGKYFTVNNRLFLSTASIAAGAMIIPGTNCAETSLAAALNALNA